MPTIAYLSNLFPTPVEPYVIEEVRELQRRGLTVIPCSARRASTELDEPLKPLCSETLYLQPIRFWALLQALWVCVSRKTLLRDFLDRALWQGHELPMRRLRALLHTILGAYLAVLLQAQRVQHIHVHHGYFSSWIAMVAARLLGIDFSMTLHGSDLLLHPHHLDLKLRNCAFCVTVSAFNRRHLLEHYPRTDPDKILVMRIGVDCHEPLIPALTKQGSGPFSMLTVGRLHPVKDQAFLIRACRSIKDRGIDVICVIAGDGPERASLVQLAYSLNLSEDVRFLGHVPHDNLEPYYESADLVVLTSRSEGVPLVLMEAMACGKPVLAPAITGIPELVIDGKTGFLYRPGSLEDFVARVEQIRNSKSALAALCHDAQRQVFEHFNRKKNLAALCDLLQTRLIPAVERNLNYEDPLLQQI